MHKDDILIHQFDPGQVGQVNWDAFVAAAKFPNPFARWHHLSAVCNGWGRKGWAIWAGSLSSKAIGPDPMTWDWAMPIPYRLGGWIKQITQPLFTQQLGALFRAELPNSIQQGVLLAILGRLSLEQRNITLAFNHDNTSELPSPAELSSHYPTLRLELAPNYLMDLNRPYQAIKDGYSANLDRKLKRQPPGQIVSYHQDQASYELVIDLFDRHINRQHNILSSRQLRRLVKVCNSWTDKGQHLVSLLRSDQTELLAGIIYLCHKPIQLGGPHQPNRYVAFIGGATDLGKKQDSQVALMDANIEHWATIGGGTYDFEGSRLPGVRQLFRTFGPVEEPYLVVRK